MRHTLSPSTARELAKVLDSAEEPDNVSASAARTRFNQLLDAAEKGRTTVVLRHSKPSAAIIPANELTTFRLVRRLLRELAETVDMSDDAEIVATVKKAQANIGRGDIVWDDPKQT